MTTIREATAGYVRAIKALRAMVGTRQWCCEIHEAAGHAQVARFSSSKNDIHQAWKENVLTDDGFCRVICGLTDVIDEITREVEKTFPARGVTVNSQFVPINCPGGDA